MFNLEDIAREAEEMLHEVADGAPLDLRSRALITLAVTVSVTSFDTVAIEVAISACLNEGIAAEAVQEIISLASGLGVHSLMEGSRRLAQRLGCVDLALDERRQELWNRHIVNNPYWKAMEIEIPGFLRSLLVLSPDTFEAFLSYCAVPWKTHNVDTLTKELSSLACDASSSHRYRAAFRMHLANALKLGAGRAAILQSLEIASQAPVHQGVM